MWGSWSSVSLVCPLKRSRSRRAKPADRPTGQLLGAANHKTSLSNARATDLMESCSEPVNPWAYKMWYG